MKNLISGFVFLLLGVWIWSYSASFPELEQGYPGPALFPRFIAVGLVLAGLGLCIGELRRSEARARIGSQLRKASDRLRGLHAAGWARLSAGALIVIAYPWIQPISGTIVALALVCATFGLLLGVRLRVALPVAFLSGAVMYFVFNQLLGVPL